jgi:hypothetical protein
MSDSILVNQMRDSKIADLQLRVKAEKAMKSKSD